MRVCVFVGDLGEIPQRKAALLAEARALSGDADPEVCFVGFRQSRPVEPGTPAYQPYVTEHYTRVRLANSTLRLAGAGLAPQGVARAALRVCGPAFVEAVLAADPDLVLLDVRWGKHLARWLEADFPERVFLTGDAAAGRRYADRSSAGPTDRVSIVLPTYNGSKYIRQSIRSCLAQSYRNIELIVVDDGSHEDMAAIVAEFDDARLRYIRHDRNRGLPATLNTGFQNATGELLTWTSDDNYYDPDAIRHMAAFLHRHPALAFVYTSMFIVDETGSGAFSRVRSALPPSALREHNGVGACFLYRRSVYREIGEYSSAAVLVEDYDYWIRVSKRFRMQRLRTPLYFYRHHDDSLTSRHGTDEVAQRVQAIRHQSGVVA